MACRRGTWNAAICDAMRPEEGDVVVAGKRGLSAFPRTDLEAHLRARGIETVALGGFMANCCVESTMREAFERGFNVVTLTDCVATTSVAGYRAAVDITYPLFSTPMNAASFRTNIRDTLKLKGNTALSPEKPLLRTSMRAPQPVPGWKVTSVSPDVYQLGPWFVDVRHGVQGMER